MKFAVESAGVKSDDPRPNESGPYQSQIRARALTGIMATECILIGVRDGISDEDENSE